MPDTTDERPPAAIGHVRFNVTDVDGASRWLATVGLRVIVSSGDLAVLELRGGTHLVVRQAERPPERPLILCSTTSGPRIAASKRRDCRLRRSDAAVFTTHSRSSGPTDGFSRSTPRMPAANLSDGRLLAGEGAGCVRIAACQD